MRGFAKFILHGRVRALLVTLVAATLSMVLPPFSHISGATVALVTLRNGAFEGTLVFLGAAGLLLLMGFLSSIDMSVVQFFVLSLVVAVWIPVLLGAAVLRRLRSLALALTTVALLALVAMLAFYLIVGDVKSWWYPLLQVLFEPLWEATSVPMSAAEQEQFLRSIADMTTGLMAVMLVYSVTINLCLGRWWQAMLFNPGGFRREFHQLRLDWRLSILVLLLALIAGLANGNVQGFAQDAMLLIMALFSLHGLALVHAVVAARGMHWGILMAVYVLVVFISQVAVMILAALGLSDSWLDFRRRMAIK